MAEDRHPRPPVVTVRGGPAPRAPRTPTPYGPALLPLLLGLVALAVVLAAIRGQRPPPPPPPVPPPVDAQLALPDDGVSVSLSGVLVVRVLLRDLGPGLEVTSASAYAEPVRTDPTALPPRRLSPGTARRFPVLLAPDCRLLTPRSGLRFRASLLLQVANGEASQQVVLDLGGDPDVQQAVRGLCRRP